MARIRTIKPEFPQSESMGRISREARLCFILLWTAVDDAGRTRASSRLLASLLYPYDEDAAGLMDAWLIELENERCIDRYEVNGNVYLQICKWKNHQKIDRPSESRFPAFDEDSRLIIEGSRGFDADLGPRKGPSTEDLGSLSVPSEPHPAKPGIVESPEEKIYQAYPRKEGHGAGITAIKKAVKKLVKGSTESKRAPMAQRDAQGLLWKATTAYARSPVGSQPDKKKLPHPATWFNQERWDDDVTNWNLSPGGSNGKPTTDESIAAKQAVIDYRESQRFVANDEDYGGRTIEAGPAGDESDGAGYAAEPVHSVA